MVPRGGEKLDPPGEGPGDVSVSVQVRRWRRR